MWEWSVKMVMSQWSIAGNTVLHYKACCLVKLGVFLHLRAPSPYNRQVVFHDWIWAGLLLYSYSDFFFFLTTVKGKEKKTGKRPKFWNLKSFEMIEFNLLVFQHYIVWNYFCVLSGVSELRPHSLFCVSKVTLSSLSLSSCTVVFLKWSFNTLAFCSLSIFFALYLMGFLFPAQELNLGPQGWKHQVLTTGPLGSSHVAFHFLSCSVNCLAFTWEFALHFVMYSLFAYYV